MDDLGFLGVAYALAWIVIAAYLLSLVRRQRSIERKIEQLSQKKNLD